MGGGCLVGSVLRRGAPSGVSAHGREHLVGSVLMGEHLVGSVLIEGAPSGVSSRSS